MNTPNTLQAKRLPVKPSDLKSDGSNPEGQNQRDQVERIRVGRWDATGFCPMIRRLGPGRVVAG
jgi:hypothetical protein